MSDAVNATAAANPSASSDSAAADGAGAEAIANGTAAALSSEAQLIADLMCERSEDYMRCGAALEKLCICIRSQQTRETLSPLLSALSPSVLRRLLALASAPTSPAETGSAAATSSGSVAPSEPSSSSKADASSAMRVLSFELLALLCNHFGFARPITEAGAVQACLSVVRREPFDNEPALYWGVRLLYLLEWDCGGLHPFITGGVLLPPLLQLCEREWVATNPQGTHVLYEVVIFVSALWRIVRKVENRPNIPAPAAAAILATPPPSNTELLEQSPMARLDSDSLTLVFSFLCGCDFLNAIRVNRRWLQFRFKPAAWPSLRPCGAHMPHMLSVFRTLLANDRTAEAAGKGLSNIDAASVRVLLDGGMLDRVLELMNRSTSSLQLTGLLLLFQFGFVDQGVFAPRLAAAPGVLPALLRLMRSPDASVHAKATTTLGNLCYGSPDQIEAVVRDGAVPVIMEQIRKRDPSLVVGHPAAALASMAFVGSDDHRRVLLREGFLPLHAEFTLRYGSRSANKPPSHRLPSESQYIIDLLGSLANMLCTAAMKPSNNPTTATSTIAEVAEWAWTGDSVAVIAREHCGPMEQWRPLLEHWNPRVCEAMERFLHDYYAQ